jgi:hypothetical protein
MRIVVTAAARRAAKARTKAVPQLFGRRARTRLLVALATNGPMHVLDIARTIGSPAHRTRDMAMHFVGVGYLTKRVKPGRKYVALVRESPLFKPLVRLLKRIAVEFEMKPKKQPRRRWYLPKGWRPDLRCSLGSRIRTSALLGIAVAEGIDMRSLSQFAGIKYPSLWSLLPFWEREDVIVSRYEGKFRRLYLNPDFFAAAELREFLNALAEQMPAVARVRTRWLQKEQAWKLRLEQSATRKRVRQAASARNKRNTQRKTG